MDFILITRKDYIDYKTKTLSPHSSQDWSISWSHDFDCMKDFVRERNNGITLSKKIVIVVALSLMIVGATSMILFALKCLFM